ncbi:MAG: glycosyltransferase family 4 protein [Candidatus Schekmanbacteria bacterium]|nr:glycosyltransferase family 4 protein [Candidatus Schekmanbacteria bacterium]
MRIAIDVSSLLGERTGIARYTLNLVANLAAVDTANEYRLFSASARNRMPPGLLPQAANFSHRHLALPAKVLYLSWLYGRKPVLQTLLGPFDVVHSPNYFIFPARHAAQVITVHDLHFFNRPEHADFFGGRMWRVSLSRHLEQVHHVIAVSAETRAEFLNRFDYSPDRVQLIEEAADPFFAEPYERERVAAELASSGVVPGGYYLWVGTTEPRKNVATLLLAYEAVTARWPDAPALVLAGRAGSEHAAIMGRIAASATLRRRVLHCGHVADARLRALYRGAVALVFPSLSEGFGLPPLEALACGTPVIVSRGLAIAARIAEAGIVVDALHGAMLADALEVLGRDRAERQRLAQRAVAVAARFTWDNLAARTRACYLAAASIAAGAGPARTALAGNTDDVAGRL